MEDNVYISGAISDIPIEDAKILFSSAAMHMSMMGFHGKIVNPFDLHDTQDKSWNEFMAVDLAELVRLAESGVAVAVLPNWRMSDGAVMELSNMVVASRRNNVKFYRLTVKDGLVTDAVELYGQWLEYFIREVSDSVLLRANMPTS